MKNFTLYHLPIAYMLLYTIAILFSGLWLFLLSQGLGTADILTTLHQMIDTPKERSYHTLIEITSPHLFAMGTLIFIMAHFMLFSGKVSFTFSRRVAVLLFYLACFNIFAYFPIASGLLVSGWIKIFSLSLFLLVFIFLIGLIGFSL